MPVLARRFSSDEKNFSLKYVYCLHGGTDFLGCVNKFLYFKIIELVFGFVLIDFFLLSLSFSLCFTFSVEIYLKNFNILSIFFTIYLDLSSYNYFDYVFIIFSSL